MLTLSADTEKLAIRLAEKAGTSPEAVIHSAVEAVARGAGLLGDSIGEVERIAKIDAARAIAARSSRRPLLDTRSDDEILGFDSNGLPE